MILFCKNQLRKSNLCNNNIKYAEDIKKKTMAYLVNCIFQILFFFLTHHGLTENRAFLSVPWLRLVASSSKRNGGWNCRNCNCQRRNCNLPCSLASISYCFLILFPGSNFFFPRCSCSYYLIQEKVQGSPLEPMPGELARIGSHCVSEIPPTPPNLLLSRWQNNHSNLNRLESCWPFCQRGKM